MITRIIPLRTLRWVEDQVLKSPARIETFLESNCEDLLETISKKKAIHLANKAIETVPAYRQLFTKQLRHPSRISSLNEFKNLPITTKDNYIKKYSYESRCVGGILPLHGNIDESSGSSGHPTNWIRDVKENDLLLKVVEFEYLYSFKPKHKRTIILSAWSSGPWATGVKFCELFEHFAVVKNTGTDQRDIIETLSTFGPEYEYIIGGYPLFLQKLFDDNKKFPWNRYTIHLITGGEGTPVHWREHFNGYLQPHSKVLSSYGCSDVDIGIGFETNISQFVRELAAKHPSLRFELFKRLGQIPMLFQYNPLMHYIENIDHDLFAVTLLDEHSASPKIRYSVEDIGGVLTYSELLGIVRKHAKREIDLFLKTEKPLRLPFLFVGGRADGTLSFDGANVFPAQIEHALRQFTDKVMNFKMEKKKDHFVLCLELKKDVRGVNKKQISKVVAKELCFLNRDYQESLANNPSLLPLIETYASGTGPFKPTKKIKFKRV